MAVWRFCRSKRPAFFGDSSACTKAAVYAKNALLGIASVVLFCPAYVIAYSIRTEINTDTMVFLIILCVISNGLLMVYANKFFTFLVTESRKGYVETALVKNLYNSYLPHGADGISYGSMLKPFKLFQGHVFGHIFKNARYQYLATVKEQASFLITGLIITEMALNIHGYLNYEMLRQMLYGNYDIVLCERGIRTFETYTRNTFDVSSIPAVTGLSHLPVIADPSHGTGRFNLVPPVAKAAVAAGADGLMIEVHPPPEKALKDGAQSLTPNNFAALMKELAAVARAVGRYV